MENLREFAVVVIGNDVTVFVANGVPVCGDVFGREVRVEIARGEADKEAGDDAAGGGVDLAAYVAS